MQTEKTLLLRRSEVERLLGLEDCITAVENVFRLQGQGKIPAPGILGIKTTRGGLHVKTGFLPADGGYIVTKLNTNFPENSAAFGLPTIQGVIVVFNANNGTPLAILDSIEITIKRTAAASAVAAKFLARRDSRVATICGCGRQAAAQLRALSIILRFERVFAFDLNEQVAKDFATSVSSCCEIDIEPVRELSEATRRSDVIVTCTPSRKSFVREDDVQSGTFISAVGADDTHKQEIDPALMASAKVVADSLEQSCAIGDTHHAIAQGLMHKEDVYAELGEIVAGKKVGRANNDEIIIFDSTGVAIEDAVAAVAVYQKARAGQIDDQFSFAA
jgi:ornithine cyclodeaminase/alanine dehydrogenase